MVKDRWAGLHARTLPSQLAWRGVCMDSRGAHRAGGLGDVMGALPKALARRGHRVMVVAPRYADYAEGWETGVRRRFRVFNSEQEVCLLLCGPRAALWVPGSCREQPSLSAGYSIIQQHACCCCAVPRHTDPSSGCSRGCSLSVTAAVSKSQGPLP